MWLEASFAAVSLLRAPLAGRLGVAPDDLATTVACGQAVMFMLSGLERVHTLGTSPERAARDVAAATHHLIENHTHRRPGGAAGKEV